MNEWSVDPSLNHHFLASARTVSSISPFYSKRGSRRKGLLGLFEGRKKINKNVNLVEKSCPRLAVGRDKAGLAEPWLTGEERLGDRQSSSQGWAEGTCLPPVAPPPSVFTVLSNPTELHFPELQRPQTQATHRTFSSFGIISPQKSWSQKSQFPWPSQSFIFSPYFP